MDCLFWYWWYSNKSKENRSFRRTMATRMKNLVIVLVIVELINISFKL